MRPERPTPADLEEVCIRLRRNDAIRRHYKCGPHTLQRWIDESGIDLTAIRTKGSVRNVPADFLTFAPTVHKESLLAHYKVGRKLLCRWLAETGVQTLQSAKKPNRPVPADFAVVAPTTSKTELKARYKTSAPVIERWLKETGVSTAAVYRVPPRSSGNMVPTRGRGGNIATVRIKSLWDEAADTLRRNGVVHRCNERGAYDDKGKFWRAGWLVLTPDELLEKAANYEARQKVAA